MKIELGLITLLIVLALNCGNFVKQNTAVSIDSAGLEISFAGNSPKIVYFGFKECPWCVEALPIAEKVAKSKGSTIYYFDTKLECNVKYYEAIVQKMCNQFNLDYLLVPFVITINSDGQIDGIHMGTVEGHNAIEHIMTKEQEKELECIYAKLFSDWEGLNC